MMMNRFKTYTIRFNKENDGLDVASIMLLKDREIFTRVLSTFSLVATRNNYERCECIHCKDISNINTDAYVEINIKKGILQTDINSIGTATTRDFNIFMYELLTHGSDNGFI